MELLVWNYGDVPICKGKFYTFLSLYIAGSFTHGTHRLIEVNAIISGGKFVGKLGKYYEKYVA